MPSVYPSSIDDLSNPAATDALATVDHALQHADANDAIEAIENELGLNPSDSVSTVRLRLESIESQAITNAERIKLAAIAANASGDLSGLQIVSSVNAALGRTSWQDANAVTASQFNALDNTVGNLLISVGGIRTDVDLKAPLSNPEFTGAPTAPTQSDTNNSTRLATTAFVRRAIGEIPLSNETLLYEDSVGLGVTSGALGTAVVLSDMINDYDAFYILFQGASNSFSQTQLVSVPPIGIVSVDDKIEDLVGGVIFESVWISAGNTLQLRVGPSSAKLNAVVGIKYARP